MKLGFAGLILSMIERGLNRSSFADRYLALSHTGRVGQLSAAKCDPPECLELNRWVVRNEKHLDGHSAE